MRRAWLRVHRCAGLALAGFLVMTGLTGSLLAWQAELDAALNPRWFRSAIPATQAMLPPMDLRAAVQQQAPQALVLRVPLSIEPGTTAAFLLRHKPGESPLRNDQYFVDPYTGAVLGARRWGDITQGVHNLMPFIYRLHYSLALGPLGAWLLGIIALAWAFDCLVGLYLTLPLRRRQGGAAHRDGWSTRWAKAWKLSFKSSWRATFDLHRAGGLWLWLALFAMAVSSLALNLPQLYDPVLESMAARQPGLGQRTAPVEAPALDWAAAYRRAQTLMRQESLARGFAVHGESSFSYDPRRGLYRYDVRSALDVKDKGGSTRIFIDANTGALAGVWLPTSGAAGDTFTTWLTGFHMASFGGAWMKAAIAALGMGIVLLSITGVAIWARKRKSR